MYLNKIKIILVSIGAWIIMGISLFFIVFSALGILIGLGNPENLREDLSIGGGLIIAFLVLFLIGRFMLRPSKYARKFNSIFEGRADGVLSVAAAAAQLRISEEKTIQQFYLALNKGYLLNCHLQSAPTAQFVLSVNTKEAASMRFRTVSCPHCGASATVQAGFTATCEYCGSKINS